MFDQIPVIIFRSTTHGQILLPQHSFKRNYNASLYLYFYSVLFHVSVYRLELGEKNNRCIKRQKNSKITSVTETVIVQPNFEIACLLRGQI
jgi:hypothetical protein